MQYSTHRIIQTHAYTNVILTVPGRPTNVNAMPSQEDCHQAVFSWNPPLEDQRNGKRRSYYLDNTNATAYHKLLGIIRQYQVRVTSANGSYDNLFVINSTSITVSTLSCCNSYTYSVSALTITSGPTSDSGTVLTFPDVSGKVVDCCHNRILRRCSNVVFGFRVCSCGDKSDKFESDVYFLDNATVPR